jgi:NAD(P)-dependent dehydrogenase (short-subunit alcohol dehydrogenase family)
MDLTGLAALVTGGGRGIGRATALALAAEIATTGRRGLTVSADLADTAAIREALQTVREGLGPVSILVNNAAVVEPLGQSVLVDPAEWARAITINLSSVFQLITATLPHMLETGLGRIVSVSSGVASGSGMMYGNAYATSKAGLEMLTRNLAAELAGSVSP